LQIIRIIDCPAGPTSPDREGDMRRFLRSKSLTLIPATSKAASQLLSEKFMKPGAVRSRCRHWDLRHINGIRSHFVWHRSEYYEASHVKEDACYERSGLHWVSD
jgi:hypothetical protein